MVASASNCPSSTVSGDGFITTVHPAASAGANVNEASVWGKFHRTMAATTPTGDRSTPIVPPNMPSRTSSPWFSTRSA